MKVDRLEEIAINKDTNHQIERLLKQCFAEYPLGRSYYKQIPNFRYLVWEKDLLIGHMAIEYRMINIGGINASIFGVGDLCVANEFRKKEIASNLLSLMEKDGISCSVDFIILMAKEKQLYLQNGFHSVNNTCKWLLINNFQTIGVGHRRIGEDLMIKAIGKKNGTKAP